VLVRVLVCLSAYTDANAMLLISQEIDPAYREFSMGVAAFASACRARSGRGRSRVGTDTCGIVLAAVTALFLECTLVKHNNLDSSNCVY
jgi:hypothetical protein